MVVRVYDRYENLGAKPLRCKSRFKLPEFVRCPDENQSVAEDASQLGALKARELFPRSFRKWCHERCDSNRTAGGQECGDLVRPLLFLMFHAVDPGVVSRSFAPARHNPDPCQRGLYVRECGRAGLVSPSR